MTSLVHPRRSPRRSWGTSPKRPRHPYGRGLEGRITVWDAMGYHGMTWASMSWPVAAPAAGRRNLGGQLMGCALKEWLRRIGTLRRAAPDCMSPAAEWLTLLAATDGCFATDLPQPELDSRVVPDARSILRG